MSKNKVFFILNFYSLTTPNFEVFKSLTMTEKFSIAKINMLKDRLI